MKETRLTLPELTLIAVTRGMLGAGIGLLLADRFPGAPAQGGRLDAPHSRRVDDHAAGNRGVQQARTSRAGTSVGSELGSIARVFRLIPSLSRRLGGATPEGT